MYRLALEARKPEYYQININTKDPTILVQQIIYHSNIDNKQTTLTLFIKPEQWDIVSLKQRYDSTLKYLSKHVNPFFALHLESMEFDILKKTLSFKDKNPQIIHQLIQALQLKNLAPAMLLRRLQLPLFTPCESEDEMDEVFESSGELSPSSNDYFEDLSPLTNSSP